MAKDERTPPGMMLYSNGVAPFINHLNDEQCGKLFKSLYFYHSDGVLPDFDDPFLSAAFGVIRQGIDDGRERYEKKIAGSEYGAYCRKEKAAGREPMPRERWEQQSAPHDSDMERRKQEIWEALNNAPSSTNANPLDNHW